MTSAVRLKSSRPASRRRYVAAVYRRPIARRTRSSPDWSGTWRWRPAAGVSRRAAISSSFTWLISIEERRSRSRPGTAPASRMSRASVKPASRSRKHPRLIPVRTTSRWPCRTRFSISASTAGARRLREAPRTSGITQKAQPKLQPSCTLTNARTRSRRASACTHPIAPTSRATASATSSLRLATTTTFAGRPFIASPPRFAEQPVTYTRWWVRAAREAAWRDFDTAS